MMFIVIGVILVVILEANKGINTRKFIKDTEPYFRFLMEKDYEFLLNVRYESEIDINDLFAKRIRNGLVTIVAMVFIFLSNFSFVKLLLSIIAGFIIFKQPYFKLKKYYKRNLHHINLMLPYYLKGLEILIQHYTVPIALGKSILTAPAVFKPGLEKLVARIEAGDSSIDPYMDFALEYPVRDSMRMMRLLYRLGLGSQENKQEQLILFSKTVSTLQNKSREQKYKERLESMENRTMLMLMVTGGGILGLLIFAMMSMLQF